MITARVVTYAAQECSWQRSGELSVAWMVSAWLYAHRRRNRPIRVADVLALGRLVEPEVNLNGLRTVGVQVGWDVKLAPDLVPHALDAHLPCVPPFDELRATRWFAEYEEIHPFRDGNGRTGSLLYNWLRGSLTEPIHPPNLWRDPRRDVPGYPEPTL